MKQLIIKETEKKIIVKITKNYLERERTKTRYQELSEEKNIKREYRKKRYHNICEEKKQKLKEYKKSIEKQKKSKNN